MDYNSAYHLTCEITLESKRSIILEVLHQSQTYRGLLEGVPSSEMNNATIEHSLREAQAQCTDDGKPLLIPPERRGYLRTPGDMDRASANPNRHPEWLPLVQCWGTFTSVFPARDKNMDGSVLVIVWYQDSFGLPTEDVLRKIKSVNWDSSAADFSY